MPQPRVSGIWLILSMLAVVWESVFPQVHGPLIRTEGAAAQAPGLIPATLKIGLPTGKTSFANIDVVIAQEAGFFAQQGPNPTSLSPGAISAAGPVQMKENSAFSFRIAHHRLVQRPQSSSLSAIAIPRDERYGRRTLSFLSL